LANAIKVCEKATEANEKQQEKLNLALKAEQDKRKELVEI
jgi:hypothetical protein